MAAEVLKTQRLVCKNPSVAAPPAKNVRGAGMGNRAIPTGIMHRLQSISGTPQSQSFEGPTRIGRGVVGDFLESGKPHPTQYRASIRPPRILTLTWGWKANQGLAPLSTEAPTYRELVYYVLNGGRVGMEGGVVRCVSGDILDGEERVPAGTWSAE
ncbi:hypothetical protein K438DRAFT_1780674 [Mycena galopus ATCC 62051]|nr:hypothetical protein K438DRAFT_1780674 [Mycena galopus ATCC 62051]